MTVVREGTYGDKVAAIEPGGLEFIPLEERHGKPSRLLWTWMSPNLEFATIFLGVLAVAAFGLSFWQAVLACALGTGLGAISHGILSAQGPSAGVPQMVLGRLPFGYWGNILPAAFNSVAAGIGWFAVNSVSAALALNTLTGLPAWLCLAIAVSVMVALGFFGHNLVQAFERYAFPVLAVILLITSVIILSKSDPGYAGSGGGVGGFLLAVGASFGYAAGWNPYAADYTRYLPPTVSRRAVGWFAGLGVFISCTVLQTVGAASVTIVGGDPLGQPTTAFTQHLPGVVASLTLLAIALGAIAANALNVYSGAMSLLALGVRLPLHLRRALMALACGVVGFTVALFGLQDAGHKYEAFLLVIAYWIGPWLGVVLTDLVLRRSFEPSVLFDPRYANWAGPIAMVVGAVASVWLFSNQQQYVGVIPKAVPAVGDIAFEVGFLISAGLYLALKPLRSRR